MADVYYVEMGWLFVASVIVQYTFAVINCLMSGKHKSPSCLHSTIHSLIYDCKDIGLTGCHIAVYALIFIFIQYPNKAWFYFKFLFPHITKSYILISAGKRSYSLCFEHHFGFFSWVNWTKGEKTGSCRMLDALRGVVWRSAFCCSSADTVTSPNVLRFILRCFTVAIFVMFLRAFYDCTLIVEALFYTESYFRIQYVLLYIKCIVWRKLNKMPFKTYISLFVLYCTWLMNWHLLFHINCIYYIMKQTDPILVFISLEKKQ